MNGHIAVRSTPGRGSTFALLVPVADACPGDRSNEDDAETGAVPGAGPYDLQPSA